MNAIVDFVSSITGKDYRSVNFSDIAKQDSESINDFMNDFLGSKAFKEMLPVALQSFPFHSTYTPTPILIPYNEGK